MNSSYYNNNIHILLKDLQNVTQEIPIELNSPRRDYQTEQWKARSNFCNISLYKFHFNKFL
jgi:hypothetical protein